MRTIVFATLAAFSPATSTPDVDRAIATRTFHPIVGALAKSPITVLLPSTLAELPKERVTANAPKFTPNGYEIWLVREPICRNQTYEVCKYGEVTAGAIEAPLTGQPLKLQIGTREIEAHYFPVSCGSSCGSTHVDFDYTGHRYRFSNKGGDVEKLRVMVSQITVRRAGEPSF